MGDTLTLETRPVPRSLWLFAAVVLLMIAGPALVSWSPIDSDYMSRNQGVSAMHWLGTDSMGRDNLARLLYGGRISLAVGAMGMAAAFFLGGGLGLVACASGGSVEFLFFGMIDLLRAMPGPLLAMTLVITLGQGIFPVVIALGSIYSPMFARIARSLYRREMSMEYVTYSLSNRATVPFILGRHILPNVAGPFLTQCGIVLPRAMVTESVLSFLGMGVSPETPTWGKMISIESANFEANPVAVLAPVVALSLVTGILAAMSSWLRMRHGGTGV